MAVDYKYYAFISYSHKDAKWAKWIQDAIEHYRLPAVIRKETKAPLPKKLSPVFRDATHLGAGKLVNNLHSELEASKFLIVVCSPSAANPNTEGKHFVDSEVRHFCELGRADRIIPVIVEGTPETSFCPKIKEEELLALDAAKFPKARIKNDIVARLLGLRPDDLWKREVRRRRRQCILRGCAALFAGLVTALGGWYWYDRNAEKVAYFKDYVDRFGVPQGVFILKKENIYSRSRSYRFHYQGYNGLFPWRRTPVLRSVFCVDSHDKPRRDTSDLPLHPDCAGRKFIYGESGRLAEIRHLRANGYETEIFRVAGANDEFIDVTRRGHDGQWGTIEWGTGEIAKGSRSDKVRRIAVKRRADGFVHQISYLKDSKGAPTSRRGVGKESYELDGLGRVVARQTYACDDRRAVGDGAKGDEFRYSYSEEGDLDSITVLQNGKVIEKMKCDIGIKNRPESPNKKYGEYGELIEERLFKEDGSIDYIVRYKYDATLSYRAETAFFDSCGNPTNNAEGWSVNTTEYQRDRDSGGSQRVDKWFDCNRNLVNKKDGCAKAVMTFDANGRCREVELYGEGGEKVVGKDGFHHAKYDCDLFGCRSRAAYFGVKGEAVIAKCGDVYYHAVHMVNDENGNALETTTLGADGKPMNIPSRGYARESKKYDSRNRIVECAFYDKDDKPVVPATMNGVWRHRTIYDDTESGGGKVAISYQLNGSHMIVTLDRQGKRSKEAYFNADGTPRVDEEGVASVAYQYDGKGREIKREYFGVDGKPTITTELFAGMETIYSEDGDEVENRRLGANGELKLDRNGVAIVKMAYDGNHRMIAKDFYGVSTNRVANIEGDYGMRWEYDERGNKTASYSIDKDGKAKPDANGIGIVRYEYDANGRIAKRRFFDVNGEPTENIEGIGGWSSEYDDSGNETCRMFFDENEKPCMCGGRVGWRMRFDEHRRVTEEESLDGMGNVVAQKLSIGDIEMSLGKVFYSYCRDGRKTVIGESFNGNTILGGARKVKVSYTRDGDMERIELMNEAGKLVNCSVLGYARKEIRYNEFKELSEESYWDADGKAAIALPEKIHKSVVHYARTKTGLILDLHNLDADGFHVVARKSGFARCVIKYDGLGRLLSFETFDAQNKPVTCGKCSKLTVTYNADGSPSTIQMEDDGATGDTVKMRLVFKGHQVECILLDINDKVKEKKIKEAADLPKEFINLGYIRYAVDSNRRPSQIVKPFE